MKESAAKSHYALLRFVKKFETALKLPAYKCFEEFLDARILTYNASEKTTDYLIDLSEISPAQDSLMLTTKLFEPSSEKSKQSHGSLRAIEGAEDFEKLGEAYMKIMSDLPEKLVTEFCPSFLVIPYILKQSIT